MVVATQQPGWVLSFQDETWWSRIAQPHLHTWSPNARDRLHALTVPPTEPKAIACYGVLLRSVGMVDRIWIRFVAGRPISGITTQFLAWGSARLATEGQRVWVVIWDNASWHRSTQVRTWVRTHNRAVKTGQRTGVRIILCFLPVQSPWLNAIEPHWMHTKRRILEPAQALTLAAIEARVCANFGCVPEDHLSLSANVS
ncbi:MAG: transposase [Chloroflexota bacterium]|nr:transposase [Chloroflexota bacterium]